MTPAGSPSTDYSEDALVEKPAIHLFGDLGWETANLFYETFGRGGTVGRETDHEVVLVRHLSNALERLNPDLPPDAIARAVEEIIRDRSVMSAEAANQDVYRLLKDGVKVKVHNEDGSESVETIRVIDWNDPANNHFFLASQFWVSGDMYRKRCDLVGFVNGIPLLFIELKASHKRLENAYKENLRDYRTAIPHLFWCNGIIILSNGSESRIGSTTAEWEHFKEWKRINEEGEEGVVSLETMVRGTCEKARLLDIVENFTVFMEAPGGLIKILGMNHQYLGVSLAIEAVRQIGENQGRLGVFWHTQGSGKSISMVFFSQKILRKMTGNWTFVVVTDRDELDDQIYKNFVACGAVTEKEAQAASGENLKQMLTEDHRYVFTLIQKFHTERGETYPMLSDRSDIIVITDEAHRSQYDTFAMNMRNALPNAAFIGFTGTPLMVGEEKTREVFGDYVSIYNFSRSVKDGATVRLFYENRVPELQIVNPNLNQDMERLLEEAELDEAQEKMLEREFAREYHLITRDDRLEKVAEDIVAHFMGRGHRGKAMVICIDKATAIRMYDKVRSYWARYLAGLRSALMEATDEERPGLEERIAYMEGTDMAVVVSPAQNEIKDMEAKGLEIAPHRERMVREDMDLKFKDADDPFRIVFVCAMWMTGFDVPSCSTIYLDKPMRNHTLMQAIARANRVWRDKVAGLIVDYVNVFRDLQQALAIYAVPTSGDGTEMPIKDKAELVALLKQAITEAIAFLNEHGIDPEAIVAAEGFDRIKLLDDAVEAIIVSDAEKRRFLTLASNTTRLYKAILPDPSAGEYAPICVLLSVLTKKITALTRPADISGVMGEVEQLLDASIATEGYVIPEPEPGTTDHLVDLGQIDFDKLKEKFAKGRKRTEIEKLKAAISRKLTAMVQMNRSRMDYLEKFQKMIDDYNAGSINIQQFFDALLKFSQDLNEEEKRGIAENLSEGELAIFDLLTKPEPTLTKKEEGGVKKVVKELLDKLKKEKLVLDWRKKQQSRQAVRLCIEEVLDTLPPVYEKEIFQEKCDLAYLHVFDAYYGEGRSIYAIAA